MVTSDQNALQNPVVRPAALRDLLAVESATFVLAAGLHAGLHIPLGFVTLSEPVIVPATIVEGAIGIALGISAYGALSRRRWAEPAAISATAVAIGGVLLGIAALTLGWGPQTPLNTWYHRTMLVVLSLGLLYLISRRGTVITGTTREGDQRSVSRG